MPTSFVASSSTELTRFFFSGSHHSFATNSVSARVAAREERCMSGSRSRIGIIVITIREVRATLQKDAEAALNELIVVALQIIAAKLVDHDDHDQLGMAS